MKEEEAFKIINALRKKQSLKPYTWYEFSEYFPKIIGQHCLLCKQPFQPIDLVTDVLYIQDNLAHEGCKDNWFNSLEVWKIEEVKL